MTAPRRPPLVCVGLPVYNGERYLEETLRCLLDQSYGNIEILVSDNASTDGTRDICERYAALDTRVHYLPSRANLGATGNVRRLGMLARAEYFKLANADDLCAPDLIASCVPVLEREPRVVLCCSRSRLIDQDGHELRDYDDEMHLRSPDRIERFRAVTGRIRLTNSLQGVMRTALVRRLFPVYGSFDGADEVLLAAIALYGEVHQVPEVLFSRRLHAAAVSAAVGDSRRQEHLDPLKRHALPAYLTKIHLGYVREIARAPVPALEKVKLLGVVANSLAAQRSAWGRELLALGRRLTRSSVDG